MSASPPRRMGSDKGAASELSELIGADRIRCADAIRENLLAGFTSEREPQTNRPPFAFRLHQLISRGDTVFASIANNADRHLTLTNQQFVPNREREQVQHCSALGLLAA